MLGSSMAKILKTRKYLHVCLPKINTSCQLILLPCFKHQPSAAGSSEIFLKSFYSVTEPPNVLPCEFCVQKLFEHVWCVQKLQYTLNLLHDLVLMKVHCLLIKFLQFSNAYRSLKTLITLIIVLILERFKKHL